MSKTPSLIKHGIMKTKTGVELYYYHELSNISKLHAQQQLETEDEIKLNSKVYTRSGQPYIDVKNLNKVL